MSRSSIFSFDTLRLNGRFEFKALLAAALVVIYAEVFLSIGLALDWIKIEKSEDDFVFPSPKYASYKGKALHVFFMGDSQVSYGLDPQAFEAEYLARRGRAFPTFNGGLNGYNMELVDMAVRSLTENYAAPKVMILAVTPMMINSQSAFMRDVTREIKRRMAASRPERALTDFKINLLYYRHEIHNAFMDRLRGSFFNRTKRENRKIFYDENLKGFEPHFTEYALAPAQKPDPRFENFSTEGVFLNKLKDILNYTKAHRIKLMLILIPVHKNFLQKFPDPARDYAAYTGRIEALAREHDVPFWNAEGDVALESRDYFDANHLNQKGARKFSRALAQKCMAIGLVETRKGEAY